MKCKHEWHLRASMPYAEWHQCRKCATIRSIKHGPVYDVYNYTIPNKEGLPLTKIIRKKAP